MPDLKISQLTPSGAQPTDLIPVARSGANFAVTAQSVANLIKYSSVASFAWKTNQSAPGAVFVPMPIVVTKAHLGMRRCILKDDLTVNYYLSPTDSTKKADGTAADLSGADGMVMVEIPKFWTRRTVEGTVITWSVSDVARAGFTVHPAFIKDGVEVNFRYYGAYDACVNTTGTTYQSGLNWDNNIGAGNGQAWDIATAKLASVSGIYPAVGLKRSDARAMAANRGTGWRQLDFTLWSAVQILYLTEYQTFFSQNTLGAGNTNGTYLSASGSQNDSPHTIAGASNFIGNETTNSVTGAGVNLKPGTSFMSYRGIENLYGNCWNWVDGVIGNPDGSVSTDQMRFWWTNNSADFSDSVSTNMTDIGVNLATGNNFTSAIASVDNFFVSTSVTGGSATTFTTDRWAGSTSTDRVVFVGGNADDGADAGAFAVFAADASSSSARTIGARLAA